MWWTGCGWITTRWIRGFVRLYPGGLVVGGRVQQAGGPLAGRDLVDVGYH